MGGEGGEIADLVLAGVPVALFVVITVILSAAGSALLASNRTKLHHMERLGDRRITRLVELTAERARAVSAIRLARQVATVALTIFATRAVLSYETHPMRLAVWAIGGIIIAILLDAVPRVMVSLRPERSALMLLPAIEASTALLGPLIASIEKGVIAPLRLVSKSPREVAWTAHEEIREAVDLLHREGGVVKDDRDMVGGVLDLSELPLSDITVHRTKMRTFDVDMPVGDLLKALIASPFTRHPLWRDEPDNIVGVLHSKELMRAIDRAGGDPGKVCVETLMTPPWFVPDTTLAADQLKAFLKRKVHLALVVDEYGEVQGLVTLEDILEEIVGDISDEQDVVIQGVRPYPDGSASVDGAVPIRDLNRMMDWRLPDDEATTIAGLVIHEARMIPDPGQSFTFHGFRFRVLRRQRNRITALKVGPVDDAFRSN
ncbi:HlyC/CorC family transporter [Pleomorphomonas sp. PLEO]|uniref:HlyC/CorC family transporter n=1 Tax=Pleomorphomonas sp. PLEO TaxID=3239306 RepID=UPI00351F3DEB